MGGAVEGQAEAEGAKRAGSGAVDSRPRSGSGVREAIPAQ